jgi:hypothetical protein
LALAATAIVPWVKERMFLGHLNYPATMARNALDGLNYCWIRTRTVIFLSR